MSDTAAAVRFRRLGPADLASMRALNQLFGAVFEEPETYQDAAPDDVYLARWLAKPDVIALIAEAKGEVVGGLVAYQLEKFEQARSEIYIYDLAVAAPHRRQGLATGLIEMTQAIAAEVGAWVVFVQADPVDPPAVALYSKLGVREDVMHFDLPVPARTGRT